MHFYMPLFWQYALFWPILDFFKVKIRAYLLNLVFYLNNIYIWNPTSESALGHWISSVQVHWQGFVSDPKSTRLFPIVHYRSSQSLYAKMAFLISEKRSWEIETIAVGMSRREGRVRNGEGHRDGDRDGESKNGDRDAHWRINSGDPGRGLV